MIRRFGFVLVALALAACGKDQVGQRPPGNDHPVRDGLRAAPEPEWKKVKTFAQALESVSLDLENDTKTASLSFSYMNVDELDPKGQPYHNYLSRFTGKLNGQGKAILANPLVPGYGAELSCADPGCENALILISHTEGRLLRGRADVLKLHHTNLGIATFHATPTKTSERSREVSEALKRHHFTNNSLTVYVVKGGETFYTALVELKNVGLKPQDPDYFDKKWVAVGGTVGKKQHTRVGAGSIRNGLTIAGSYPCEADVEYHPRHERIGIHFIDTPAMHHHLNALIIGKKTILGEADRR